jgi:anti-sigma factor (TIGR02949 family)
VDLFGTDCDEVLRDLDLYLDGELPAARARVVERHLSECSPCLSRGEFRRRVIEIVRTKCRSAQPEEPPPSLHVRIRRSIGLQISSGPDDRS